MKKSLLAFAALTAFAGVASAQSSITLFGVVDLNARNVKNDTLSQKTLSTDGNASSRPRSCCQLAPSLPRSRPRAVYLSSVERSRSGTGTLSNWLAPTESARAATS